MSDSILAKIKRKVSHSKEEKLIKCDYRSESECPYTSTKQCKYDKSNCHIVNKKKTRVKSYKSISSIVILALSGLIIYILATIASLDPEFAFKHSSYVYSIVIGLALSLVTGSILAVVIDIPTRLKDYELSFVNALTSNNYLKSLDEERLTNLRKDITNQLHKAEAPAMAAGLIEIDQQICELLREPYYSRYRHSVVCKYDKNEKYINKEHSIEYRLVNPYSVNRSSVEYIQFTNHIIDDEGKADGSILGLTLLCRIDDGEELNFSDRIKFEYEDVEHEFYNKKITIEEKTTEKRKKKGIRVEFKKYIEVKLRYTIKVDIKDPCFTKRLQHPAKNFRLDYACLDKEESEIKLYGQIFGTGIKQSDVSVKYSPNSISLETFDWLLPDNGAMVVMLTKRKNDQVEQTKE